jgi:type III secretion protein D
MERVQQALGAAGVSGLQARLVDRRVVVEGLLQDNAQVARARGALMPFGEGVLLHRYAAATDIARQISDALHGAGVSVVYAGGGVFKVQGQSEDVARLREEVARIAADVGPLVARIDVEVQEALPTGRVRLGAMWHGDGLQYVQTADGTKHLSLQSPTGDEPASPDGSLPHSHPIPDGEPDDQPSRTDGVR